MKLHLLLAFVSFTLLPIGCDGPSGTTDAGGGDVVVPSDAPPTDAPGGLPELFPLRVGASWTFQVTSGGTLVGEKTQRVLELGTHPDVDGPVFVLETTKPSGRRTVSYQRREGNDTVRYLEEVFEGTTFMQRESYDPFKLRISDEMSVVGSTRTETYTERVYDMTQTLVNELIKTEEWTVSAIESVTVPAGTFDNAVRIDRSNTVTGVSKSYWFVSGVGKVREVANGQTEELTSYSIP